MGLAGRGGDSTYIRKSEGRYIHFCLQRIYPRHRSGPGLSRQAGLVEVNTAEKSSDPTKYRRLRDELWWMVRENCAKARYSFPDVKPPGETESLGETLANELASVRYEYNGSQLVVESKKALKLRGVASPNIADALCISEDVYSLAHKIFPSKTKKQKELEARRSSAAYPGRHTSLPGQHDWMVV